jgi:hypothetical protein
VDGNGGAAEPAYSKVSGVDQAVLFLLSTVGKTPGRPGLTHSLTTRVSPRETAQNGPDLSGMRVGDALDVFCVLCFVFCVLCFASCLL